MTFASIFFVSNGRTPFAGREPFGRVGFLQRRARHDAGRSIHMAGETIRILRDNPILGHESNLWYFVVPLIHSKVAEWHLADRVLRQILSIIILNMIVKKNTLFFFKSLMESGYKRVKLVCHAIL